MDKVIEKLEKPFSVEEVDFKPQALSKDTQKARVAVYIDARLAAKRLNEVFPFKWSDSYDVISSNDVTVVECTINVNIGDAENSQWISRSDVGAAQGWAGENKENIWKGAYSDAFKRAAVKFGIGSYLYSFPNIWVPCGEYGFKPDIVEKLRLIYADFIAGKPVDYNKYFPQAEVIKEEKATAGEKDWEEEEEEEADGWKPEEHDMRVFFGKAKSAGFTKEYNGKQITDKEKVYGFLREQGLEFTKLTKKKFQTVLDMFDKMQKIREVM